MVIIHKYPKGIMYNHHHIRQANMVTPTPYSCFISMSFKEKKINFETSKPVLDLQQCSVPTSDRPEAGCGPNLPKGLTDKPR